MMGAHNRCASLITTEVRLMLSRNIVRRFVPYGIVLVTVAAITLCTLALGPLAAPARYPLFFFASIVLAWRYGVGPGLVAVLLSGLCLVYFTFPTAYSLNVELRACLRLGWLVMAAFGLILLDQSRRRAEKHQARLIQNLRAALAEIGRLRNLLPICASCKKIRDAGGSWIEVEAYLRRVAGSEFTHGLCPGCAERLYP
jgi:K+-sensing histidine kinase KdpD